jgi:FMNH2-dependent dimethyl sulfone monooxygenase
MLGLFLPMQQGAWSPSKAPRSTSWTFDYIARCTCMAKELGFDLVFGLAQWLGKGGYGGDMHFREHEVDPIIANAALSSLTKSIVLINTVHVLYAPARSAWNSLTINPHASQIEELSTDPRKSSEQQRQRFSPEPPP